MTVFDQLGVRTIINARGSATRLGGGHMAPAAVAAMAEASQYCVDMAELQGRASELISEITGAQAGIVTAGAAAGLLLGTAACVAGLSPVAMDRLPDTQGLRYRVVMARSQRNGYDHAVRTVGAEIVEVGLPDRQAGAGVRDVEAWELAAALDEHTACICYVAHPRAQPSLREVVAVAHAAGVPVLVDAAAQLPPVDNLQVFIEEGADLVTFSGGKAIGGPQASGILCGRRDLVASALLQMLDQDLLLGQWVPPPTLFDGLPLTGLPHHGIGRPCKVGKEQIVGLLFALRAFIAEDSQERHARWRHRMDHLAAYLESIPYLQLVMVDRGVSDTPRLQAHLAEEAAGITALALALRLQSGRPAIHIDISRAHDGVLIFDPSCLQDHEPTLIGERLADLLAR